jgi:caa(3)-type oxidase subunit IV
MAEARPHPTPKTYWSIALFLAVVTAIEIAIPYMDSLDAIKVPALLILGGIKFLAVVGFFMHLRFDKPLYRSLFFVGVIGAIPLFIVVLLTFRAL